MTKSMILLLLCPLFIYYVNAQVTFKNVTYDGFACPKAKDYFPLKPSTNFFLLTGLTDLINSTTLNGALQPTVGCNLNVTLNRTGEFYVALFFQNYFSLPTVNDTGKFRAKYTFGGQVAGSLQLTIPGPWSPNTPVFVQHCQHLTLPVGTTPSYNISTNVSLNAGGSIKANASLQSITGFLSGSANVSIIVITNASGIITAGQTVSMNITVQPTGAAVGGNLPSGTLIVITSNDINEYIVYNNNTMLYYATPSTTGALQVDFAYSGDVTYRCYEKTVTTTDTTTFTLRSTPAPTTTARPTTTIHPTTTQKNKGHN